VLAAPAGGQILGADMTISSSTSSNLEVGEELVYTIDTLSRESRRVSRSGNYPSSGTPRSADTCNWVTDSAR
jgi:hypothetical protein